MNYLLLENYLVTSNDEYVTVRLTERSASVLLEEERILMKMAKDIPSDGGNPQVVPIIMPARGKGKEKAEGKRSSSKAAGLSDLDDKKRLLFEQLRTLRMEIAKEEKVPPYIVFSDKTLVQMCMVCPGSKEEMLMVSGVGEFKYEKYGERFLEYLKNLDNQF